jgi:hypothetical protein
MYETFDVKYFKKNSCYNKLIFHPSFKKIINELSNLKIQLPNNTLDFSFDFNLFGYPPDGKILMKIEEDNKYILDSHKGQEYIKSNLITAYDESIIKFMGLEGIGYLTSHSLILHGTDDFIPNNYITFYFYTKSNKLCEQSKYIKYADDAEVQSKYDYIKDRFDFLINNVPDNSILFIDGPLIGKQMTHQTIDLNAQLSKKNIIPIFFVKNSDSNLVTEYSSNLKGLFNSDMHWSYKLLQPGERTSLYKYTDADSNEKAKFFCYIKAFDVSPIRIEIDVKTYLLNKGKFNDIFDLIYYLLLIQGDLKNPQLRTIAIAEKYARSTLNLINFPQLMKDLGITPTMNQERGFL